MRRSILFASALFAGLALFGRPARAANTLTIVGAPALDPLTVVALGVQLLVSDDDNYNAKVALRYRKMGAAAWSNGLPLHRVHPEVVIGYSVPAQFAGSIFDLSPGTTYEIELHATDPDGAFDQTLTLQGATRPVPSLDP